MDVFRRFSPWCRCLRRLRARSASSAVQLGIISLSKLELGYLTPPVVMNLCRLAYRFQKPSASVCQSTISSYLILVAGVLLITYAQPVTMAPVEWFASRGEGS